MNKANPSWHENLMNISEDWRVIYQNPIYIRASLAHLRENIQKEEMADNDRAILAEDIDRIERQLEYLDKRIADASTYNHPMMEPFTKITATIFGRGARIQSTAKELLDLVTSNGDGEMGSKIPVLT
jgi:predicted RNA binding protein with dsRBD fold (UPF0201 family)